MSLHQHSVCQSGRRRFRRIIGRTALVAALFAPSAWADEPAQVEARKHFQQGVAFVDSRRLPEALAEFERCYALYPAYGTLYNIGQVHAALGQPVAAVEAFEKYLADGGAVIVAARRARVEKELATQREQLAELAVQVTPAEAELRIDDHPVARSGAAVKRWVTAGQHLLSASLAGYQTQQRSLAVRAKDRVEVALTLELQPPVVAAVAPLPRPAEPAAQAEASGELARHRSQQRLAGYLVTGVGLAGVGAGIAIAALGQAKHNDALDQWYAGDREGARSTEAASSDQKTAGYVVIGVGGAATLVGAILLLTARSPASSATPPSATARTDWNCSPWLMPSVLGASLQRRW
ncbi:MAG TPA: hypothetical protein VJV79_23985 [Polyangiaceae bacterium]|nr:hypothetical protein [Polyangiaceae bacterium]